MKSQVVIFLALLGSGCSFLDPGMQDYYTGDPPGEFTLSVTSEQGNLGGNTLTINGSGFGSSPDSVLVMFGDHNGRITAVEDSRIEVVTPAGPVDGGAVTVTVGTEGGYTRVEGAYTYDMDPLHQPSNPGFYDTETGYISLNNYYNTLFGDAYGWVGQAGAGGAAEFLDFVYPRYHTQDVGMFSGIGDQVPGGDWILQSPANVNYFTGLEDLRLDIGSFQVENPVLMGETDCIEWDSMLLADPDDCEEDLDGAAASYGSVITYDKGIMQFCEPQWLDTRDKWRYTTEYPLGFDTGSYPGGPGNFFEASEESEDGTTQVVIRSEKLFGKEEGGTAKGVTLALPSQAVFLGTKGFKDPEAWTEGSMNACFPDPDSDDVNTYLDNTALRFEWEPYAGDLVANNAALDGTNGNYKVQDVRHYVRVSMTLMSTGWFYGDGYPMRTTMVVADDHDFDEETGRAGVDVPVEVLYQFPTAVISTSSMYAVADPTDPWALMLVETTRVTEYRISTELGNDIIVSYNSGDMGYFYDFVNPAEGGTCGNCLDDDGDGWVDTDDPDCQDGTEEDGSIVMACNNGLDDDGDGLADRLDPDCTSGEDYESECQNGKDDDWDGWLDEDDPECADPSGSEEDFGATQCNNGEDDDADGWADSEDLACILNGPLWDAERPAMTAACADGLDNDMDGFVDALDPDCEMNTSDAEFNLAWMGEDAPFQCYDGLDNDADGLLDALDPGCVDPANGDQPNGFLNDESVR